MLHQVVGLEHSVVIGYCPKPVPHQQPGVAIQALPVPEPFFAGAQRGMA